MTSLSHKFIEHTFFFIVLGISAYLVWNLFAPFIGSLALAAIIVTICYPLHERIARFYKGRSPSLSALTSLLVVIVAVVTPLAILASLILREALSIYGLFNSSEKLSFMNSLGNIETFIQSYIPSFSFDIASVVQQTASFFVEHLLSIFAGTASTIFLFFIALIASFYFFRDGREFTRHLIHLSPLKDADDAHIIGRLASAIRSVALGTISVAMIQGVLTAVGLAVLGFERAILWGCIAAVGALIPGVGTAIVFIPSVIFLISESSYGGAVILGIWGILAVGLIDNILGPYVMSRGNKVHPFLILLSVLGGLSLFGPIGFILGPVILSLFLVLLELYHSYIKKSEG